MIRLRGKIVGIQAASIITAESVAFPVSEIADGQTVFLGIEADDGTNDPVAGYASGSVTRDDPDP